MILDWKQVRRRNVPRFLRAIAVRHPECARVLAWADILTIAQREQIAVRRVKLPDAQRARLVRFGERVWIQVNAALSLAEATTAAAHELVHFWRDDPGVACYYAEEGDNSEAEHFADTAAWVLTSPARTFLEKPQ